VERFEAWSFGPAGLNGLAGSLSFAQSETGKCGFTPFRVGPRNLGPGGRLVLPWKRIVRTSDGGPGVGGGVLHGAVDGVAGE
jgi:hypothetical protein